MCFFSNIRCAMHAVSSSTSRPRRWRCRVLRRKASSSSLASLSCLHLFGDAMDLVSASHGSDRLGRVWSWLSSARKSMLLPEVAAGAARGRAVPQDLRAGTQHRPMEMRRAGIAFITWKHVCALFAHCAISYSRRVTLQADVPSIPKAFVGLNKNKTSAVRSLIYDAGGTK